MIITGRPDSMLALFLFALIITLIIIHIYVALIATIIVLLALFVYTSA